jgi:hypothetical protein
MGCVGFDLARRNPPSWRWQPSVAPRPHPLGAAKVGDTGVGANVRRSCQVSQVGPWSRQYTYFTLLVHFSVWVRAPGPSTSPLLHRIVRRKPGHPYSRFEGAPTLLRTQSFQDALHPIRLSCRFESLAIQIHSRADAKHPELRFRVLLSAGPSEVEVALVKLFRFLRCSADQREAQVRPEWAMIADAGEPSTPTP